MAGKKLTGRERTESRFADGFTAVLRKLFTFHEKWRKWGGGSWRDSYLLVKKRVVRTRKLMYNNQQKFMDAAQGPESELGGVTVQI